MTRQKRERGMASLLLKVLVINIDDDSISINELAGKCALGVALILGEPLVEEVLLPVGQGLVQEADVECVDESPRAPRAAA